MRLLNLCAAGVLIAASVQAGPDAKPPADPSTEYDKRAAKLGKDVQGWMDLADFCEDHVLVDKREKALRKVVSLEPDHAEAHRRLDEAKAGDKWIPVEQADAQDIQSHEAKKLVFYGKEWMDPKDAAPLRQADRLAQDWALDFRMDTPHFQIFSARSLILTRRIAALLENGLVTYQHRYGGVWTLEAEITPPLRVFLFRDHGDYLKRAGADYTGDLKSQTTMGEFYNNTLRTLYLGQMESEAGRGQETIDALSCANAVHSEAFALDDVLAHMLGLFPTHPWLMKGRADQASCAIVGRQVLPGTVRIPPHDTRRVQLQLALHAVTLDSLLSLNLENFGAKDREPRNVVSWAFVHFLFHGEGGCHAEGYRAFLKGLPDHGDKEDFEKAVGKLADLKGPFEEYAHRVLIADATKAKKR